MYYLRHFSWRWNLYFSLWAFLRLVHNWSATAKLLSVRSIGSGSCQYWVGIRSFCRRYGFFCLFRGFACLWSGHFWTFTALTTIEAVKSRLNDCLPWNEPIVTGLIVLWPIFIHLVFLGCILQAMLLYFACSKFLELLSPNAFQLVFVSILLVGSKRLLFRIDIFEADCVGWAYIICRIFLSTVFSSHLRAPKSVLTSIRVFDVFNFSEKSLQIGFTSL